MIEKEPTYSNTIRFNIGGEQAEADPLLRSGFYGSVHYETLISHDDPRCFVIGRTGSGKSAIFQRIEDQFPGHVIRISPEDLSLPYIVDLNVIQYLSDLGVKLDTLFIALWKHVFLIEIIKNRYSVNSPEAKNNFLNNIREKLRRDKSKEAALDYLDEFEGKFWCETDERVRDITKKFEEQIASTAEGSLSVAPGSAGATRSSGANYAEESITTQTERFQRVVNETQLPRLNKMITVLKEDILDSMQEYRYVILDDLDRDWVDEKILNTLIRCLFRAVVDFKKVRNLKVLVALRSNIFECLDFGSTSGQEEKYRSLKYDIRWTRRELEEMLTVRAKAAIRRHTSREISSVFELLPKVNRTRGNAMDYVLSRTLQRPRDAISFLNECFSEGGGVSKISWEAIHGAETQYSISRLLALRDEWKPSYPGVDRLFELFRSVSPLMDRVEVSKRLDDVALLIADDRVELNNWLWDLAEPIWNNGASYGWESIYSKLVEFLYRLGFLCVVNNRRNNFVAVYDDPAYVSTLASLRGVSRFMVHPTFCKALDIPIDDIWKKGGGLDLSQ